MNDVDQHDPTRLEKATESTIAKAFNRFVTPAMVAIIGWLALQAFNDIKSEQVVTKVERAEDQRSFQELKTDVKLLNAKLDFSVLQQIETLQRRVDNLEKMPRSQRVEP